MHKISKDKPTIVQDFKTLKINEKFMITLVLKKTCSE